MTVCLPRASARACKPSGRSAYRMVMMSVPVRMPPAPASLPGMNTEGDNLITDDHTMRDEPGPGRAGRGRPPRARDLAAHRAARATLKGVAAAARQAGG